MSSANTFLVNKQNFYETSRTTIEPAELTDGEVLFKIDRYAFTANNITYAVCGYLLKYWNFFPTEEPWGIVPVWGYAEVAASKSDDIKTGELYYGYFPMSEYLTVKAGKTNAFGFSDIAKHRQEMSPIYNFYSRLNSDPHYKEELKDYIPIIKPLFATSFLIYHFLKDENFFEGEQIFLTSASSKTALSLAYMLRQNQTEDAKKIIGLTSKGNVGFVKSTNYFDEVITYDDYQTLPTAPTAIVDFAGNAPLLHNVSNHLGNKIKYISRIGITDWKADKSFENLPNSQFFFAPTHIEKRYKEWGAEKTSALLNTALIQFINETKETIEITRIENFEELSKVYLDMLDGKTNPKNGYIIKL